MTIGCASLMSGSANDGLSELQASAWRAQGQGQELGPGLAKRSCTARPPGQEPELSNRLIDVHKTAYASFGESLARNTW